MLRQMTTVVLLLLMATMATMAQAQKAGLGAWEDSRDVMLEWIEDTEGLGWYYNWRPDQIWHRGGQSRSVEFVPMIWGRADLGKPIQSNLRPTHLLGFNEPDGQRSGQSNISVEEAIALWPQLEAYGLRLGSPAPTGGQTIGPNSWLGRFMAQADARGLRVDFIAVHYYSTNGDVADFERFLTEVYRAYRRPVWVTEYARIDWNRPGAVTYEQNAAFAQAAIPMLERLPFVERHAWFAANPYDWGGQILRLNLVDDNLQLTSLGATFVQVLEQRGWIAVAAADGATRTE